MDAIKGLARRVTQTVREKVSNPEVSNDDKLNETTRKVRAMEKSAVTLSDKILRAAKLIEELGGIFRDVSEELRQVPDVLPEIQSLVDESAAFANVVLQKVPEHQASLKDQGFDQLGNFIREVTKLRDAEEDRKKKQLEYDFFKQKVMELRRNPPKDFTRIPRNEQLLEQWRVELWKSTESNKALVSTLFAQGQRSIDQAFVTLGQVSNSFYGILSSGLKHTYGNARFPLYSPAPVLQPEPLPPNPLPPFVYPQQPGQPGQPGYDHQSPPNQQAWGQPQAGSPQQQWGAPPPGQQQQQWGQQQQQSPQNNSWGSQPPQSQPSWGSPQQQPQQHQQPQQQQQWQQPPQQQQQWQTQPQQQQQAPPQHQQQPSWAQPTESAPSNWNTQPQSQHQQQQQPSWNTQQAAPPANATPSAPASHVSSTHEVHPQQQQQPEAAAPASQ